jgi:hypothetical protein
LRGATPLIPDRTNVAAVSNWESSLVGKIIREGCTALVTSSSILERLVPANSPSEQAFRRLPVPPKAAILFDQTGVKIVLLDRSDRPIR